MSRGDQSQRVEVSVGAEKSRPKALSASTVRALGPVVFAIVFGAGGGVVTARVSQPAATVVTAPAPEVVADHELRLRKMEQERADDRVERAQFKQEVVDGLKSLKLSIDDLRGLWPQQHKR